MSGATYLAIFAIALLLIAAVASYQPNKRNNRDD